MKKNARDIVGLDTCCINVPELNLKGVRALVTGGAGFIGSHLCDALVRAGARVRVLDDLSTGRLERLRDCLGQVEFVEGDIRDAKLCKRVCEGVAFVFHQAAIASVPLSMDDPQTALSVNVGGTVNVFSAAREAGVRRVVYASSTSVFGDSAAPVKREGEEGRVMSVYALSKRMNEELGEVYFRLLGLETVGVRYFNIYGPRQSKEGAYAAVIPCFFDACARSDRPVIFGDGLQSRDFVYVADAVRANLLAAAAPLSCCGKTYNIGSGQSISMLDLAYAICRTMGVAEEVVFEPERPGDVRHSRASGERAAAELGFDARVPLSEGLLYLKQALLEGNVA